MFLLLPLSGCSSLLYYPTRLLYVPPEKVDAKPKPVWLKGQDGTWLYGWYLTKHPDRPPKALIVFFHGNGENMTSHYVSLLWILRHGYDFFTFDYRGYGLSQGEPSPKNTVEDGKIAVRWAKERWPHIPLIIFGQSLGGAVAMRCAIELKKEGFKYDLVAVESTFPSYKAAGMKLMASHWFTWILQPFAWLFLSDAHAPDDEIGTISPVPMIVIHGDKDTIVDFSLGEEVFLLAKEPKEFWRVPGGSHIQAFWKKDSDIRERFIRKLNGLHK